ncbi:MAG TPA: sugar ABC transporter permease [Chloroflexota bacterium]|jgi:multiple sugar transport system permease protein
MSTETASGQHLSTPHSALSTRNRLSAWLDREDVLGYILVAPVALVVLGFLAYPFGLALWLSLTDKVIGGDAHYVGLQNYERIWPNGIFQGAVRNTLIFTACSIAAKLPIGFALALLLNEKIRFRKAFRSAVLLPWIIPTVLSAMAWLWLYNPNFSILNYVIANLGLGSGIRWLTDPNIALFSVVLVNVWRGTPFYAITLLAGMQAIPNELYEATSIDGANRWQRFRHVTLPLVMPIMLITLLLSTIGTFSDFATIYSITGGGPMNATQVISTYSYGTALGAGRMGEGAAISLTMFPFLMVMMIWEIRWLMKRQSA